MTKRLFAIVLAAILAITMFTFPTFAEGETGTGLTYESNSKSITAIWQSLGADIVRYDLTLYRDGIKVSSASVTDVSKPLKYVFTGISTGGNYEVVVDGKTINQSNAMPAATKTLRDCYVPVTSSSGSGSKKITVSSDSNNVLTATWEVQTNADRYRVDFSYKKDGTTYNNTAISNTNSFSFTGITYANLVSVKVTAGNANGYNSSNFASWTNSGVSGGSSSSTNGLNTSGAIEAVVQNGYVYITINDVNYYSYRYGIVTNGSSTPGSYQYIGSTKTFYVPISNIYGGMVIVVEGSYYNTQYGNWSPVGYATVMAYNNGYYPNYPWGGNTSMGGYGVQITNSNGVLTAYWGGASTAIGYFIRGTASDGRVVAESTSYNYYQFPAGSATTNWNLMVYALMPNGQSTYIGTGYFTGTGSNTTNLYGITKSEIKGLTVTPVSSISTSLTWKRYNGASYYWIIYGGLDGSNMSENMVYQTTASIPYNSKTAYYATVYAMDGAGNRLAEVGHVYNVPGTTADTNKPASTDKDYPSNLTARSQNKAVKLTWKAAKNASYYNIYFKKSSSSKWTKVTQNGVTYKATGTSVTLRGLTNNVEYDFKVVPNNGSESGVVTMAPSTSSRTATAPDPSDDGDISLGEDEDLVVTSVSSTSKGKISITWNNVGAPSYKVYVADSANPKRYKPCGTFTGTSATISKFGSGSSAVSFTSGKTYIVRILRTDYTGSASDALNACSPKTVVVK